MHIRGMSGVGRSLHAASASSSGIQVLDLVAGADAVACASTVRRAIRSAPPARSSASRSHQAIVGSYPSTKMGEVFAVESKVEERVLVLADALESVVAYRPQAVRVAFGHEGRCCIAYPDVAVSYIDGSLELWECKPRGGLGQAALNRLVSLRASLRSVDVIYRVRQPHWSCREPRAGNARLLLRYADYAIPAGLAASAAGAVRSGASTLGDVQRMTGRSRPELLALVACGVLGLDIGTALIGSESLVRLPRPGATSGGFDGSVGPQGD